MSQSSGDHGTVLDFGQISGVGSLFSGARESAGPLRVSRRKATSHLSLGSLRGDPSEGSGLLSLRDQVLLLPMGARTEMMIFLEREEGRTVCDFAGRSVCFGSLGKEWTKSAPGLEPTMM